MPSPAEFSGLGLLSQQWLPCTWSCGVHSLSPVWWRSLVQACFHRCSWPGLTPADVSGLGPLLWRFLAWAWSSRVLWLSSTPLEVPYSRLDPQRSLPTAGILNVSHHIEFMWHWESNPGFCACARSTLLIYCISSPRKDFLN